MAVGWVMGDVTGDAEDHGVDGPAFASPLERAEPTPAGILLRSVVRSRCGFWPRHGRTAPDWRRRRSPPELPGIDPAAAPARQLLLQGKSYDTLQGRSPFARLIYPVPEAAGLGVHVTVDLAGQCRFGPDTEWIESIDYDVDPCRAATLTPRCARSGRSSPTAPWPRATPAFGRSSTREARRPETSRFKLPECHGVSGPAQPVRHREPGPHRRLAPRLRGGTPPGLPELEQPW